MAFDAVRAVGIVAGMTHEQTNVTPEVSPRGRMIRLAFCVLVAAVIWNLPIPAAVQEVVRKKAADGSITEQTVQVLISEAGWRCFAVFIATILSFILRPLPMGPMVLISLASLGFSQVIDPTKSPTLGLPAKEGGLILYGYGSGTVWLVVIAFFIAGAVASTGLGRRIALTLIHKLGRTTLGLGYAACGSELLLGPLVPSNTARGGGLMAPIMDVMARALGSTPENGPNRAGRYLMLVGAHANLIAASMFMTGMAANPLVSKSAKDIFDLDFSWGTWALGAIVPGLVSMALLPLVLYRLARPEMNEAGEARALAGEELKKLGGWTWQEYALVGVFLAMVAMWITKPWHKTDSDLVAIGGACLLIVGGVVTWKQLCSNAAAWDALVWLGGLVSMAEILSAEGAIRWFAIATKDQLSGLDLGPVMLVLGLGLVYFYSMYGFSMLTAHIMAMVPAFFGVAAALNAPPMLTVAVFAYLSCLSACTTNYSTGPLIIYFGQGYVTAPRWFGVGFVISLFHLIVWLGVGMPWWKLLGWW